MAPPALQAQPPGGSQLRFLLFLLLLLLLLSWPSQGDALAMPEQRPSGPESQLNADELRGRFQDLLSRLHANQSREDSNSEPSPDPAVRILSPEGPRSRKPKKKNPNKEDKRPRTAFTAEQLQRLKAEFQTNRYLTEQRRQSLAQELSLNESQIKIWFQNKRAKIKKATGNKNTLAVHLMAQGLYNHSTTAKEGKSDSE